MILFQSLLAAVEMLNRYAGRSLAICTFGIALIIGTGDLAAQHEDLLADDEYRQGLVGTYRDSRGNSFQRVDELLSFVWQGQTADPRLATGPLSIQWQGYLLSQAVGEYRLYVYGSGDVQVKLAGQLVLDGQSERATWFRSEPIELAFDWHPLEISYRNEQQTAQIALYWSGPQFQLEPVGPRQLYHDPPQTPDERFERGQMLVRALRCAGCHQDLGQRLATAAPALDKLAGNIHSAWLVEWLANHQPQAATEEDLAERARRMPFFALERYEATALAAYLLENSTRAAPDVKLPQGDRHNGEHLFLTLGCLACHRRGELGGGGLFGGGDLTEIARKRPSDFFERWLADPARINVHHRMPVYTLSREERGDLAVYLASLGTTPGEGAVPVEAAVSSARPSRELVEQGRRLYELHRCAACHATSDRQRRATQTHWEQPQSDDVWQDSCLAAPSSQRPGYQLSPADRDAVQSYLTALPSDGTRDESAPDGAYLLAETNCLACHARDTAPGLGAHLQQISQHHPELAPLLPAMNPPPLVSVGDKLHDEALAASIQRSADVHRPWLLVRMPKFRLSDAELAALLQHFVAVDRIPEHAPGANPLESEEDELALALAGRRLVTPDGFGCTSCHQIGKTTPPKAPLNAMGPDLSMLGRRIRLSWFDRWVRNPARIIPRMEMPSMQIPVQGVLEQDLDSQLAAVWHVLNQRGFEPPEPNPVRLVRQSGVAERNQPAAVLTDVLRIGEQSYLKPLLIGLPNRHNVLIDLDNSRLAGWWIGDVARQRTEGKTWYWEAAGDDLLGGWPQGSDLRLGYGDTWQSPLRQGQFITEFDAVEHVAGGIVIEHRLHFPSEGPQPQVVRVRQQWTAAGFPGQDLRTGFVREIHASGLRPKQALQVRLMAAEQASNWSLSAERDLLTSRSGHAIELVEPVGAALRSEGTVTALAPAGASETFVRLRYLTGLPVDQFVIEPIAFPPPDPVPLDVVPGFEAMQLPLAEHLMPTALAWKPDGRLVVASLKGRVWLAQDTDGDELEDELQVFSDELAAPFGVLAGTDYVDVINKYALLRLWDRDDDGHAERIETLASGWGHTADYHDWAIGLVDDEQGNYYVALPCQQDERSPAAAHLRGTVLRLQRRSAASTDPPPYGIRGTGLRLMRQAAMSRDPRQFTLETISEGHRFPIGMARSRQGELFVTDNQGNYNPFNELNHVQAGAHYGFINELERRPGFRPPLTAPAIDIPHPWTRSVNGICFLETPAALREQGHQLFGPFEGHLIGCEYDTRMLVRMSLQQVGATYQGAAYPLSLYHPQDGITFLGPLSCAVAPDGDVYIGCLRDSGWGGANNIGSIVRMRPALEQLPAGIAEVRLEKDGFTIDFTRAVDKSRAARKANYTISSYTRESTPEYGGPDQQRRVEQLQSVTVAQDGKQVRLKLPELRAGFVYELRLKNLAPSGQIFFPAEAYYTLQAKL